MASKKSEYRFERGGASDGPPSSTALWGLKTEMLRGFAPVAGDYRAQLLDGLLLVKKACAQTNAELGILDAGLARTIGQCCDEILSGQWREQFFLNTVLVDVDSFLQKNLNEVIANRSTIILGGHAGKYEYVNPETHLQWNQPANEVFQIALRVSLLSGLRVLQNSLLDLERLLRRKSLEFDRVDSIRDLKSADPSKLTGHKFNVYGSKIERSVKRNNDVCLGLLDLSCLTKSGTESGEQARFAQIFIEKIKVVSNFNFRGTELPSGIVQSVSDFVELSSVLKELALELRQICKELRSDIDEQRLADKLANPLASSSENLYGDENLMPLNTLMMVALDIVGKDMTISLCAQESGDKKLTVMPLIAESLLSSIDSLCKSLPVFNAKTLSGFQPRSSNPPDLRAAYNADGASHIVL